ncbi:hypothetical protein Q9314_28235 (plasmid) [Shinella sumterensis]|uniref:hypothetical protein n=1 Tax=Shinella sp. TaxID=1870904 RepID=UPI00273E9E48|nr:hypothetical protein [Shinella sp.]WLS11919.1 hypothetical protein Q9314_28235 [Shinella sumterensis]
MNKDRLENTRDYFENITKAAYRQFMAGEVTFLAVYSLATGLYHIGEWMCVHDLAKVQAKFGAGIVKSADLWHQVVEKHVPDAGFIRDLNNAAKHAKLTFPTKKGGPSTAMHHSANTFIQTTGYGEGGYGEGPYGGGPEVKMDEGGREVQLEPIATAVFHFWEALVEEFYATPAAVVVTAGPPTANS